MKNEISKRGGVKGGGNDEDLIVLRSGGRLSLLSTHLSGHAAFLSVCAGSNPAKKMKEKSKENIFMIFIVAISMRSQFSQKSKCGKNIF